MTSISSIFSLPSQGTSAAINGNSASSTSTASAASAASSLVSANGQQLQDQFLKLLVSQMKNQDPLNPMDSAQMTSQLAQISSVQGIQNLNSSITSLLGQMNSLQTLDSANTVGSTALVNGSSLVLANNASTGTPIAVGGYQLPSTADAGTISIKNASGAVVQTLPMSALTQGVNTFQWNGMQADGTQAPAGTYTFAINASSGGKAVAATTLSAGVVQGIQQNANGVPQLNLGPLGLQPMSAVVEMI